MGTGTAAAGRSARRHGLSESVPSAKPRDKPPPVVLNVAMASRSARTAPKGKATPARNSGGGEGTLLTPTIQWILVVLFGLLVIAAIIYFGSDFGDGGSGVTQSGLAAIAVVEPTAGAA